VKKNTPLTERRVLCPDDFCHVHIPLQLLLLLHGGDLGVLVT